SEEADAVARELAEFSPLTARDLKFTWPAGLGKDAGFYPDFYVLSRADVAAISNSSFGFAACMLNDRGKRFVRSHWESPQRFEAFDPWDAEPILWVRPNRFYKSVRQVLSISRRTQGVGGMLKCLCFYLPGNLVSILVSRLWLAFMTDRWQGMSRTLKRAMREGLLPR